MSTPTDVPSNISQAEHQTVRRDIQGLRGAAIIAVVAFHSGLPLDGGFLGVDIFMVVSGYVIAALLRREAEGSGAISLRKFYVRRAKRLLPALAVNLIGVAAASIVLLSPFDPQQLAYRTGTWSAVFLANVDLYRNTGYFDSASAMNPFLHLWSLAVEEQFYLVFPMLLVAALILREPHLRRTPSRFGAPPQDVAFLLTATRLVAALSLMSFGLSMALTHGWFSLGLQAPERFAFYSTPTRFWEFGLGIAVALHRERLERGLRRFADPAGAGALATLMVTVVLADPGAPHPALPALAVTGATAALIAVGSDPSHRAAQAMSARPLCWFGERSYAWYLWHWPAIVFAKVLWPGTPWSAPIAAAAAILPAMASTRFIEAPFRRRPSLSRQQLALLVAFGTVLPITVFGRATSAANSGLGLARPTGWSDIPSNMENGCHYYNRDGRAVWPEASCTTWPPRSKGTVMIVGDQHAASVAPAVISLASRDRLRTAVWTRSGCPMSGVVPVHSPACVQWQRDVLALVDRVRPVAIFVANESMSYTDDPHSERSVATASGRHPGSREEAVLRWTTGLKLLLDQFAQRRIPVVLVGPVVDFGPTFPSDRISLAVPQPEVPSVLRSSFVRSAARTTEAERTAIERTASAAYVDPVPELCATRCTPLDGDTWLYYDRSHLTNAGSMRLAPALKAALDEVLPDR